MAKPPSMEDLKTMYQNCLVIVKNKPYLVNRIYDHLRYGVFDLSDQRNKDITVTSHTDLKAPSRCFGFVNIGGVVYYLSRLPVRRYKAGACGNDNMQFESPDDYRGIAANVNVDPMYNLTSPHVADTIYNRYPSIVDAVERCKAGDKIVAFDRQFAVDHRGYVYYKLSCVGKVAKPKTVYDIAFTKGREYLITLLDNNHEKSIPTA
jgi:hypothetical protein